MRKLVPLALVAVLAVVAWLLFFQKHESSPQTGGETPAAEPASSAAPSLQADEPERVSPAPALEPVTNRPVKVGAGRFGLHGTVVDEAGRPVPGAWVAAYSAPFPILDFELDIEEIFTRPLNLSLEPLASSFADAEGKFDLAGVPGRTAYLVARTFQRLTPGRQRVLPEELDGEEGVLLRTVAGADLQGTVLDADGQPVAGAEVLVAPGLKYLIAAFRNRHFFAERAFTDAAGNFSVEAVPSDFALAAAAFNGPVRSGLAEFGPLAPRSSGRVTVRMDPMGGLSGEVVTSEDKAASGAMVVAVPLDLRRLVPFIRDPSSWTASTGGNGKYQFPELPRGQFLVIAQGRQGRSAPMQAAVLDAGSAAPKLVLDTQSVITGRVLNARGEPVAGAKVQLMSIPSTGENREDATRRAGGLLFTVAQEILPEFLPDATFARTETDGGFRIAGWRSARLRVSAPGYVQSDFEMGQIDAERKPVLLLYQPGAVEGVVMDAGKGKPVQFYLVRGEADELLGQSVRAARGESRPRRSRGEEPATPAEDNAAAAAAKVTEALQKDFAELAAELKPEEDLVLPMESWRAELEASVFCDAADGRFRLDGLPPGKWEIGVQAPNYARAEADDVPVRSGETTKGVIINLSRGATVSGRVLSKGNGQPVEGAMVTLGRGQELGFTAMLQGLDDNTAIGESQADGSFFIQGAREGDDHVNVVAAGHASATQEIPPLQAMEERTDVVVELSAGGVITGIVTDRHGLPLGGRMVGAVSMQARDFQQTATDEHGRYRMEHMRPGSYFLLTAGLDDESLFSGDFAAMLSSSRILTAYVAEGEVTTVDIVDESAGGCRLSGKLVKAGLPLPGANLAVFATERSGLLDFRISTARTDEFGEFEFKSLAPGEYVLNVEAEDWDGQLELEVADVPEDYRVLEVPRTEVRGRVVAEGSGAPVPQASVRLVREDGLASSMFGMFGGGEGAATKMADTNEQGDFLFEGVSPGRYHLEVSGQSWWGEEREDSVPLGRAELPSFELGFNEVKQLDTVRLPVAGNIKVSVVDGSGEPVERGIQVRAVPLDRKAEDADAGEEERLRGFGWNGTGWVRGVAAGSYRLEVESEGYAPASLAAVEVTEGETTEVQVTLRRGANLNLRILDANNRPIGNAKVEVVDPDGVVVNRDDGIGAAFARFFGGNQDGSYRLGTFAPGSYTVRATYEGRVREVPVTLLEGQDELAEIRF
ncbi:MAG: PEGA domain-containing protein [Planctomycetota bacterium]|nr:MAG: PEGA domain-containing protein [Planctomycetota bacterium]